MNWRTAANQPAICVTLSEFLFVVEVDRRCRLLLCLFLKRPSIHHGFSRNCERCWVCLLSWPPFRVSSNVKPRLPADSSSSSSSRKRFIVFSDQRLWAFSGAIGSDQISCFYVVVSFHGWRRPHNNNDDENRSLPSWFCLFTAMTGNTF